jgi:hypothetical protein
VEKTELVAQNDNLDTGFTCCRRSGLPESQFGPSRFAQPGAPQLDVTLPADLLLGADVGGLGGC